MSVFWKNANLRLAFEYIAKDNVQEARAYLEKAIQDGDHYAYVTLHECYTNGGFGIVALSFHETDLFIKRMKAKFNPFFPNDIYDTYEQGNVFAQYYQFCNENDVKWLKLAADAGFALAQYRWYTETQDTLYLEKAANQEFESAKITFGQEWLRRENKREAAKWFVRCFNGEEHVFNRCNGFSITFEERYVYGQYLQSKTDQETNDFDIEHVDLFEELVSLYNRTNSIAEMNAICWLLVSKRLGIMKDLRILISKYIWQSRFWENPPRRKKK
jgi:hypothetical protein